MPDYYVNITTGQDSNPGTLDLPVATITRATELAAESDLATGTIHVEPGTYGLREVFPILVPPRFGLEGNGSSAEDTRIEFTGTVRGTSYHGVAIQGGASVRNLTIVADPPAFDPITCSFSVGLSVRIDGCQVEDVIDKLSETAAVDSSSFGDGIYIDGADAVLNHVISEKSGIIAVNCNAEIRGCKVTNGSVGVGGNGGATIVEDCIFRDGSLSVGLGTETIIRGNTVNGGRISITGDSRLPAERGPTIRLNRVFGGMSGIRWQGTGYALIENNTIQASRWTVTINTGGFGGMASPFFRINTFHLSNHSDPFSLVRSDCLLKVTRSSNPGFEANTFIIDSSALPLRPFVVEGPADFGGGERRSLGNNHFGRIWGGHMNFDYAGMIFARHNFWQVLPPQYHSGRRTTVDTEGARLDS